MAPVMNLTTLSTLYVFVCLCGPELVSIWPTDQLATVFFTEMSFQEACPRRS